MKASNDAVMVFLGDYGDRWPCQTELYYTVLSLKDSFPEQVILMRAYHEGPSILWLLLTTCPINFKPN
jgi:hypothetical protein